MYIIIVTIIIIIIIIIIIYWSVIMSLIPLLCRSSFSVIENYQ